MGTEANNTGPSLAEAALRYARKGWPVFPLKPRGKTPIPITGLKAATTDESLIRAWWQQNPDANIGLITGELSGLAVVDIDPRHGGDETLAALIDLHGNTPDTPESLTGGGGRHLLFNFQKGFKNTANAIGKGIDTRGEGGYIVAPPSIHESGKEYEWEASSDPEQVGLAEIPEWLHPGKAPKQLAAGNLPFQAGIGKATGEPVTPGGRNVAAASLAGQYVQQGDSAREVLRKLREWNAGNPQPLPAREIEQTAASVCATHVNKNPGAEIRIDDAPAPSQQPRKEIPTFPIHLLNPPGLVGEICRWINETAIKPQPVLTLGNVLAFFGAAIGRKVRTPSDLRSNLYVLGVGESGCGKDHSRKAIKKICEAAGLTHEILGGEEVSSDSAILSAVHGKPTILFQFDEIGHFLANANSKYAAVHQKNIAPTFTKLFSSANTVYIGKEYAGRDREDIVQPNVCLYGTTVPGRLYEGLTPGEISDGFLGRMIVFQSNDNDPTEREIGAAVPPESIISMVQAWHQRQDLPKAEGNIASLREHIPITVELQDEAVGLYQEFRAECRRRKLESRGMGGLDILWSRAVEHALKTGLIVACGCQFQNPTVSGDVAAWTIELIDHVVTALVEAVKDSVAGSDYERQLLMVQRIITDAGADGITRSALSRSARRLTPRLLDEILNHLLSNQAVHKESRKSAKGAGAPSNVYRRVN